MSIRRRHRRHLPAKPLDTFAEGPQRFNVTRLFYLSRPWDNCQPCLLWQKRGILNWRSAVLCGKKYRSINETLGHLQLCFQPKNTSLNLLWFRRSRQKISSLSDLHLFPQSAEMSPVAKKHQYSSVRLLLDVYVYVYMYVTSKYYN